MTVDFWTLRRTAASLFDQQTMERVIDPVFADVQMEYANAIRHGRVLKSRWILMAGCITLLKVVILCGLPGGWPAGERSALNRTLSFSFVAMVATTAVFAAPPLLRAPFQPRDPRLLVYLIPQALVLSVPVGCTIGAFVALRGRIVSRRARGAIMACAICWSLACLANLAWLTPLANHEFRQLFFAHAANEFPPATVVKGINELTLGELGERLDVFRRTGLAFGSIGPDSVSEASLSHAYHVRWALSSATFVLAAFALSVTRHVAARWTVALAASGTFVGYYSLMWFGRAAVLRDTLPASAGAWLPNVVFAVASAALLKLASEQSSPKSVE